MRRTLVLVWILTLGVFAADKSNFSGAWKLNSEQSDFGPMPGKPDKFERKVEQTGDAMKVTTTQSFNGQERTTEVSYQIDGEEHVVKYGNGEAKVTAVWKGKDLEVTAKREAQGMSLTSVEKWVLAEDGKTLNVASLISLPQGEVNLKLVFQKQ